MNNLDGKIIREYRCQICDTVHKVELSPNLIKYKKKFPFPHVFLHGELKEYLTILYIDANLQIRASEVQNLSLDNDNVFSKDHTFKIVSNLVNEIENLRDQQHNLFPKEQVKIIITNLMYEIEKLYRENEKLTKELERLSQI